MPDGRLFVICAPSGAGKSTLIQAIRPRFPDMLYSVSCTTRPPRPGEQNGVHYFFLTEDRFTEMVRGKEFLEWKQVHGNRYGTPAGPVAEALRVGKRMLLDIDVQGAAEVFRRFPEAVGIFILAPGLEELERRLRTRGTDSEASIETRLRNAREELEAADSFAHRVVNDRLDRATEELARIIEERSK
jgi:guanylate kinase